MPRLVNARNALARKILLLISLKKHRIRAGTGQEPGWELSERSGKAQKVCAGVESYGLYMV